MLKAELRYGGYAASESDIVDALLKGAKTADAMKYFKKK